MGRRDGDVPTVALPDLTREQMQQVDRIMIEQLGIELIQMMENAGRSLAQLAITRYAPNRVTVLVGPGGNGGGGLVAARHLHNRGVAVTVTPSRAADMRDVSAHQLAIIERMGVAVSERPVAADLVVDALIGYSLTGDPRGRAAELIGWVNGSGTCVLALDVPSGLDVTTGHAGNPCVSADATLTLALPKTGLRGRAQVGALFAADISVPPAVYAPLGVTVDAPFAADPIVRVAD